MEKRVMSLYKYHLSLNGEPHHFLSLLQEKDDLRRHKQDAYLWAECSEQKKKKHIEHHHHFFFRVDYIVAEFLLVNLPSCTEYA